MTGLYTWANVERNVLALLLMCKLTCRYLFVFDIVVDIVLGSCRRGKQMTDKLVKKSKAEEAHNLTKQGTDCC